MKNKKLNLNELRVKSFVTEFDADKAKTVNGGLFSWFWCRDDPDPSANGHPSCDPNVYCGSAVSGDDGCQEFKDTHLMCNQ